MSTFIQEVLGLLNRKKSVDTIDLSKDYFELGRRRDSTLLTVGYNPSMDPYVIKASDFVCSIKSDILQGSYNYIPVYVDSADPDCPKGHFIDSKIYQDPITKTIVIQDDLQLDYDLYDNAGSPGTPGQVLTKTPTGVQWSASGGTPYALNVEDEGVVVLSNPGVINFVGDGVSVQENPFPSGIAEVTIPGFTFDVQDEGILSKTDPAYINFKGLGVQALGLPSGGVDVTIFSGIEVQNNGGSIVSNPSAINFTGSGVTVTQSPVGVAQVSIAATVANAAFYQTLGSTTPSNLNGLSLLYLGSSDGTKTGWQFSATGDTQYVSSIGSFRKEFGGNGTNIDDFVRNVQLITSTPLKYTRVDDGTGFLSIDSLYLTAGKKPKRVISGKPLLSLLGRSAALTIIGEDTTTSSALTLEDGNETEWAYFYNDQSVQLKNNTTAKDSSAILQLDSDTKGFLVPRLTTAEKTSIATPATSLMVFDTNLNEFNYYDGSAWVGFNTQKYTALLGFYSNFTISIGSTFTYYDLNPSPATVSSKSPSDAPFTLDDSAATITYTGSDVINVVITASVTATINTTDGTKRNYTFQIIRSTAGAPAGALGTLILKGESLNTDSITWFSSITTMATGETIKLQVANQTDTQDIVINRFNFEIRQV